jgi:hypothetical protein
MGGVCCRRDTVFMVAAVGARVIRRCEDKKGDKPFSLNELPDSSFLLKKP